MEKILGVYHKIDLDGWFSAAILMYYYYNIESKNVIVNMNGVEVLKQNEPTLILDLHGYNYNDQIDENFFDNYDQVFVMDVSFKNVLMEYLAKKLGKKFHYIDHHAPKILSVSEFIDFKNISSTVNTANTPADRKAACELTWEHLFGDNWDLPTIVKNISDFDCFRHKSFSKEESLATLEFQYGAGYFIHNPLEAYRYLLYSEDEAHNLHEIRYHGKIIYSDLKDQARQLYKNKSDLVVYDISGNAYKACITNKMRLNFSNFDIDYHKDGYDVQLCFHFSKGTWYFSVYNENGKVDCASIAYKYGGGGHKGAAGFVMTSIDSFLSNLLL